MAHTETNYAPDPRSDEVIVPRRYGNLGNLYGDGDPNGVVNGRAGWTFHDETGGNLYINTGSGYNATWTLHSGASGGVQVLSGTADPVAAPSSSSAMFYRTDVVRVLSWSGSQWDVVVSEV